MAWSYDMEGLAQKCVERYCELANKKVEQLYTVSSFCLDDHQFKQEELESAGELSQVCSQIVLKCLYLARVGRPDILWSLNKLPRSVTKRTQACDRRLARLISTNDYRQYCHVVNTAQHCRLGLFQESDFAGDLDDSNQLWESLVYLRKPNICPHQLLLALDFWDVVIEVLRSTNNTKRPMRQAPGNWSGTVDFSINENKSKTPTEKRKREVEMWTTYSPTHILLKASLLRTF